MKFKKDYISCKTWIFWGGFWGIDINIYNGIKKIYFFCLVGLFETSKYISEYPDDFIA